MEKITFQEETSLLELMREELKKIQQSVGRDCEFNGMEEIACSYFAKGAKFIINKIKGGHIKNG